MTTPNELRLLAQRLREHNDNPHHINPMSERFSELVNEATETLSSLAGVLAAIDNCGQVMGRIYRDRDGSVVCALNSIGLELPDDTRLFAHLAAEPAAPARETDAESRAAWIAVVLQKYPTAEIKVVGTCGVAHWNALQIGTWRPHAWTVK